MHPSFPSARSVVIASFCFALTFAAVAAVRDSSNAKTPAPDLISHSAGTWGINLTDRDLSIKPGDDFFMYQNGGWFARTELSPQVPFAAYWNDLRKLSPRRLIAILEEVAANKSATPDSAAGKAGAFYRAFMDEKMAESKGVRPLDPQLETIKAAKTKKKMTELMGTIAGSRTKRGPARSNQPADRALFSMNIGQDQTEPNRYAVYVGQAGLGLPGPEYYMDPKLADIKAAYATYVTRALSLIGWPNPETRANEVVAFESRIAEVSWSHEQMRDPVQTYNAMSVTELSNLAPGFDWPAFLGGAEVGNLSRLVIDAKSAFPKIAHIFDETPIEVLQAQQAFVLVDEAGLILNTDVFKANFDFRVRMFSNQSMAPRPRSFNAWITLEAAIGDALGSLYIERYFSPEAKASALEMAANLKKAFDARLQNATWMSPATKAKARAKLAAMTVNIGYPDKLQDYKGLEISDTDLYGDVERATAFNWHALVARLSGPFDRCYWVYTPQSVNYSYTPSSNTLEIPAGTFQPPFFDLHADPAVNYGAVGVMIGATMASGFDNQGRHYDSDGRLQDWWTSEEVKIFEAMTRRLSDQYSAIEPLPGMHVKGELVVDEAIDDLTGWQIALDAYHLSLRGQPAPVLDGITGDQRVFLGRAQMWRAKFPPDFVRNLLATGANAMPFLRVNGPIRNMDAWYEAFDVKPNDKMYIAPDARVHVW